MILVQYHKNRHLLAIMVGSISSMQGYVEQVALEVVLDRRVVARHYFLNHFQINEVTLDLNFVKQIKQVVVVACVRFDCKH